MSVSEGGLELLAQAKHRPPRPRPRLSRVATRHTGRPVSSEGGDDDRQHRHDPGPRPGADVNSMVVPASRGLLRHGRGPATAGHGAGSAARAAPRTPRCGRSVPGCSPRLFGRFGSPYTRREAAAGGQHARRATVPRRGAAVEDGRPAGGSADRSTGHCRRSSRSRSGGTSADPWPAPTLTAVPIAAVRRSSCVGSRSMLRTTAVRRPRPVVVRARRPGGALAAVGTGFTDSTDLPRSESSTAHDLLAQVGCEPDEGVRVSAAGDRRHPSVAGATERG
jgi:hypothetical protein